MKTHPLFRFVLAALTLALMAAAPTSSPAAAISPSATGDAAVAAGIGGRVNLALGSGGATAFSSTDLTPDYAAARVNDGVKDQSGNSWIPLTTAATEYVGVKFAAPAAVSGIVFHGETGYNGRSGGTWVLQATTAPAPTGSSTWTEIGTYTYTEAGCVTPMPRSLFTFPAIQGVTGVRLLLANAACTIQLAVQELEAYGPVTARPNITAQPAGATVVAGDIFTFSVTAEGAESFQWRKNNTNIAGATGSSYTISEVTTSHAGSYLVVAGNTSGSVTSSPAILQVTAAPTFASYTEAVLSDNPIHYYPLDETNGTIAADLGSLATTGGTFRGGYVLGQPAVSARLGRSVLFDGNSGSMVDLGLFHPGDSISVEAWVQLAPDARNASYHAIVARWDGSYELDFATTDAGNFVVRRDGNGFGAGVAASSSTRGGWHHVVGVFHAGLVTIYVDGVKGSEQNIGGVLQNMGPTPDRVMIGATREGVFNFKGSIDEVAIYDAPLSAAQVRAHFRATAAGAPTLAIQNAVIVSWPSFPPGYVLQSASVVTGPYANYTNAIYAEGNLFKAAVPVGGPYKYFQLLQP